MVHCNSFVGYLLSKKKVNITLQFKLFYFSCKLAYNSFTNKSNIISLILGQRSEKYDLLYSVLHIYIILNIRNHIQCGHPSKIGTPNLHEQHNIFRENRLPQIFSTKLALSKQVALIKKKKIFSTTEVLATLALQMWGLQEICEEFADFS